MNQNLVIELRQMFIDGATPTKLMQRIVEHHGQPKKLRFAIGDYFMEAFGIPLLRTVGPETDYAPDLAYALWNRDIIPEIISRIDEWNTESLEGTCLKDCWCDLEKNTKKGSANDHSKNWNECGMI